MENTREYRNLDLVNEEKKALKLAAQPTFRSYTIFHENLFAVERYKTSVKLDKPVYTGVAVLDLSKLLMNDFHYKHMKEKFPRSLVCFTDTDSLLYKVETENIYKHMLEYHELFDLSDYPDQHSIFEGMKEVEVKKLKAENKKKVGLMKDELKGNLLLEFIGLRAKAYSFLYETEYIDEQTNSKYIVIEEVEKLKGMKTCVVKKNIDHDHYKVCLFIGTNRYETMRTFRSYKHNIVTVQQNKLALARFDDKRWIQDDGVTTFAHGHYNTL